MARTQKSLMHRRLSGVLALLAGLLAGTTVRAGEPDGLEVRGLGGQLDEQALRKAFRAKAYDIERCILGLAKPMTWLEGTMTFVFEVWPDGRRRIRLADSDLGHYQVEACLWKVVRTVRLPRAKGGKAKGRYPLHVPNRGTPHVVWKASRIRRVMRGRRRAVLACRRGRRPRHFVVTMYILPGGRLGASGVFAKGGLPEGFAACVHEKLKNAPFPDTFGKVVKVRYRF